MCDVHVEVVYDNPEVVGRNAVGAKEHQIIELRVRHCDRPFDEVVEADVAPVGISEPHDRRPVRRRHEPGGFRALGAPAPVESGHCTRWNCSGRRSPASEKICYTSQPRAVSSAVEHSPHTGGAIGSIPIPPTTSFTSPGSRVSLSTIHGACTDG